MRFARRPRPGSSCGGPHIVRAAVERCAMSAKCDRRVFAKFKHLLRTAAARSAETICVTIGEILRAFTPTECANYFRRYAQS
jgi:hypothetical protein